VMVSSCSVMVRGWLGDGPRWFDGGPKVVQGGLVRGWLDDGSGVAWWLSGVAW
jgi:hypothetical protein